MTCNETLALLSFRRLISLPARSGMVRPPSEFANPSERHDPVGKADDQREDLVKAIRKGIDYLWLTIEVFIAREMLEPLLNSDDQKAFFALCQSPLFAHLGSAVPGAERQQLWRQLHYSRKSGAFGPEWEGSQLEQLAGRDSVGDLESLQGLEWQSLWQLAKGIDQEEATGLKYFLPLHSDHGDSLLVRLITAFAAHELNLADASAPDAALSDTLPEELLAWLQRHSESLDSFLEQLSAGVVTVPMHQGSEVQAQIRNALALAQAGDFARSVLEITEIVQAHPTSAGAYVARGDAHRLSGNLGLANGDYTAALRLEPANVSALLKRGQLQALQGRQPLAIADFTAALQQDTRSALAYHHRGKAYADSGDWQKAIADFGLALQIDPTNPWTFHYRGDAHAALGNPDQAIADYSNALRLSPQATLSFVRRGDAYRQKGEFDPAIADYGNALRLDPLDVGAIARRGAVYQATGNHEQALADFDRALALDAANVELFRLRGQLFQSRGEYDKAIADFSAALHLDSDNFLICHERGMVYQALGALDRALADIDRSVRNNPKFATGYDSRGQLYTSLDRLDLALADYTRALTLDPEYTLAYVHRAELYLRVGRPADALADCDQAQELDPDLPVIHVTRGVALAHAADYRAAVENFTQALRLDARNAEAYYYRGLARAKQKALVGALADLSEALRLQPENARAYAARAVVQALAGEDETAVGDLAAAARLDSRYAAAYCNQRARVHTRKGRYQQAAADYSLALLLERDNVNARTGLKQVLHALESAPPLDALESEKANGQAEKTNERVASTVSGEKPARSDDLELLPLVAQPKKGAKPIESDSQPALGAPRFPESSSESFPLLVDAGFPATAVELTTDAYVHPALPEVQLSLTPDSVSDLVLPSSVEPPALAAAAQLSSSAALAPALKQASKPAAPKSGTRAPTVPKSRPPSTPALPASSPASKPVSPKTPVPRPAPSSKSQPAGTSTTSTEFLLPEDTGKPKVQPPSHHAAAPRPPRSAVLDDNERAAAQDRTRETAEIERRAAALRARQEAEQKRNREAWAASRRRDSRAEREEDDRTLIERLRKPLLAAAGVFIFAWVAYSAYGYRQTHRKDDPPLHADKVWQDYVDDAQSANSKYADRRVSVVGKIMIEASSPRGPREVYFLTPTSQQLRIHCKFLAANELFEVPSGPSPTAYLITGIFEPYEKGPIVEFKQCVFVGGSNTETALWPNKNSEASSLLSARADPHLLGNDPDCSLNLNLPLLETRYLALVPAPVKRSYGFQGRTLCAIDKVKGSIGVFS